MSNESTFIFPLTDRLLYSMAMRYRHDFGLLPKNDEAYIKTLHKMEELYNLYVQGFSDAEIAEKSGFYIGNISQIREETNGEGFYKE